MPLKEGDEINCKAGHYEVMEILGDGCYATVYLVMDLNDEHSRLYALKAINKRHLKKNPELGPNLIREVKIHRGLDHPNILHFYKEFDDGTYIYFLLEFVTPGEIYDVLYMERKEESDESDDQSEDQQKDDQQSDDQQSGGSQSDVDEDAPFSEDESRDYFFQLILSLIYLRDKGIIHRDIKPENILLTEDGVIKLCDFGWGTSKPSDSIVGTPEYNAPEMVRGSHKYDYKSDLWSAGVVLFEFLYRKRPFHAKHARGSKAKERETEKRICSGRIPFPSDDDVSEEAKDLIRKIFTKDPRARPDYEQVLAHPWMMNWAKKLKVSEHSWMQDICGHSWMQQWLKQQRVYSPELTDAWLQQYSEWTARSKTTTTSSSTRSRGSTRSRSSTRSRGHTASRSPSPIRPMSTDMEKIRFDKPPVLKERVTGSDYKIKSSVTDDQKSTTSTTKPVDPIKKPISISGMRLV